MIKERNKELFFYLELILIFFFLERIFGRFLLYRAAEGIRPLLPYSPGFFAAVLIILYIFIRKRNLLNIFNFNFNFDHTAKSLLV